MTTCPIPIPSGTIVASDDNGRVRLALPNSATVTVGADGTSLGWSYSLGGGAHGTPDEMGEFVARLATFRFGEPTVDADAVEAALVAAAERADIANDQAQLALETAQADAERCKHAKAQAWAAVLSWRTAARPTLEAVSRGN